MNNIQLLTILGKIPPAAWDWIVPHTPAVVTLIPVRQVVSTATLQPLEALTVHAAMLTHNLVAFASERNQRGESSHDVVHEVVDDWSVAAWPQKWQWPGTNLRPTEKPWPDPWHVNVSRIVGALVLASAGSRLGNTPLAQDLMSGAEKLIRAVDQDR